MESTAVQAPKQVFDWTLRIAELLQNDPDKVLLYVVILFLMVIIAWEKREKKTFIFNTLDVLADQVDALATEVKTMSDAQIQQTTLLQTTLSFSRGIGEDRHVSNRNQKDRTEKRRSTAEGGQDSS